jgi:hypothetical protein
MGPFGLVFLVILILGVFTEAWQPTLLGFSGLIALAMYWIAFKSRARCSVQLENGKFCSRWGNGILLGCKRNHRTAKLQAWLRYLGLGYIGDLLNIEIPILPWQIKEGSRQYVKARNAYHRATDSNGSVAGVPAGEHGANTSGTTKREDPPIAVQVAIALVSFLANVATVVAFALTIVKYGSG